MKRVLAVLVGAVLASLATAAAAHVVEITTSIPAVAASNDADLREAVVSAIDDAVNHTIAFTPTVVAVQGARRVGDRIYLMLLIVDREGEELLRQLEAAVASSSGATSARDDADVGSF